MFQLLLFCVPFFLKENMTEEMRQFRIANEPHVHVCVEGQV